MKMDPGHFNPTTAYTESSTTGSSGHNVASQGSFRSLPRVHMTSYIAVGGAGAKYVDVNVFPPSQSDDDLSYYGWDGRFFRKGPAIETNGYYWYRKVVTWEGFVEAWADKYRSGGSSTFFAKSSRTPRGEAHKPFHLYAFRNSPVVPVTSLTCEKHGLKIIDSREGCMAARKSIGWETRTGTPNAFTIPWTVDGCSFNTVNDFLFYNQKGNCVPGSRIHDPFRNVDERATCLCSDINPCACRL